jgi:hypothetical protein
MIEITLLGGQTVQVTLRELQDILHHCENLSLHRDCLIIIGVSAVIELWSVNRSPKISGCTL